MALLQLLAFGGGRERKGEREKKRSMMIIVVAENNYYPSSILIKNQNAYDGERERERSGAIIIPNTMSCWARYQSYDVNCTTLIVCSWWCCLLDDNVVSWWWSLYRCYDTKGHIYLSWLLLLLLSFITINTLQIAFSILDKDFTRVVVFETTVVFPSSRMPMLMTMIMIIVVIVLICREAWLFTRMMHHEWVFVWEEFDQI